MRTGRTPADRPIVAVVARQLDGRRWVAITGVAATPVLVNSTTAAGASLLHLEMAWRRAIRTGLPGSSRSAISEVRASTAEPWHGS